MIVPRTSPAGVSRAAAAAVTVAVAAAVAAGGVVAAIPASAEPADAPAPSGVVPVVVGQGLVVKQGAPILIGGGGTETRRCTIGYNDVNQRTSFTAGHCGTLGSPVYLYGENGVLHNAPAGYLTPSKAYHEEQYSNDWATITWNPDVRIEANRFGDKRMEATELAIGDEVCFYGNTTASAAGQPSCGPYRGSVGTSIFFAPERPSQFGDSGGPVFAPGRGLLGVVSGLSWLPDIDGARLITLERASTLKDGPVIPTRQMTDWLYTQLPAEPRVNPAQSRVPDQTGGTDQSRYAGAPTGSAGSSSAADADPVTVTAAVLGVIVALGALAALAPVVADALGFQLPPMLQTLLPPLPPMPPVQPRG